MAERRTSVLERRRRQACLIAIVIALAMIAIVAVPFFASAEQRRSPALAGRAEVPPEALSALGSDATAVRSVWLWSTPFLTGATDGAPVVSADQWVAAVVTDGRPIGTRTAWRDPAEGGAVVLAGSDDNRSLAAALVALDPDDMLVTDRGEWLVVGDGSVRSLLSDDPLATVTEPTPLVEMQAARAAVHAADLAAAQDGDGALAGGGDGSEPPPPRLSPDLGPRWTTAAIAMAGVGLVATMVLLLRNRGGRRGDGP